MKQTGVFTTDYRRFGPGCCVVIGTNQRVFRVEAPGAKQIHLQQQHIRVKQTNTNK